MPSIIKAGNATDGVQVSSDSTGTLDIKTGSGAGTTAISIDASQNVSITGGLTVTGTLSGAAPIQPISASVAANALTVTLNQTSLSFRSTTLTSGAVTTVAVSSPISLTVPSSATLGTLNNVAARLVLIALNNAGTVELGIVNISGGTNLDETNLLSTTAISAAATSASVVYSTSARTDVAFRVVGFVDITQATAGTWASAPTKVQGVGGQALTALSSLGYGQTYQDVTASRTAGTTYYNTTGKPISATLTLPSGGTVLNVYINGAFLANPGNYAMGTFIIPPGSSYRYTFAAGSTLSGWTELR